MEECYYFRYSLNPVPKKNFTMNIEFDDEIVKTYEDLEVNKNKVFKEKLSLLVEIIDEKKELLDFKIKKINFLKDVYIYRLAKLKHISVETNFQKNKINNEPSFLLVVDTQSQLLIVQKNSSAYSDVNNAAKKINKIFENLLQHSDINIEIFPIISVKEFWSTVETYKYSIIQACFLITAPNMPSLSKNLSKSLKKSIKKTKARQAKLSFDAMNGNNLEISKEDDNINSLVQYISEGCGEMNLKVKGNKCIKIGKNIRKIVLSEDDIKSLNHEEILNLLENYHTEV